MGAEPGSPEIKILEDEHNLVETDFHVHQSLIGLR